MSSLHGFVIFAIAIVGIFQVSRPRISSIPHSSVRAGSCLSGSFTTVNSMVGVIPTITPDYFLVSVTFVYHKKICDMSFLRMILLSMDEDSNWKSHLFPGKMIPWGLKAVGVVYFTYYVRCDFLHMKHFIHCFFFILFYFCFYVKSFVVIINSILNNWILHTSKMSAM